MSWPRTAWTEAIWASTLQPSEKLVALAYADHAREKAQTWVSYRRLTERTGYSRRWCVAAVRVLRETGWLIVADKARQHRSAVYTLAIPAASSSHSAPLDGSQGCTTQRPRGANNSAPPKDISKGEPMQYRDATSKAQRAESTSPGASAATSPGNGQPRALTVASSDGELRCAVPGCGRERRHGLHTCNAADHMPRELDYQATA